MKELGKVPFVEGICASAVASSDFVQSIPLGGRSGPGSKVPIVSAPTLSLIIPECNSQLLIYS